jgi:PIN domain nuclease of toxin-antitoxin system
MSAFVLDASALLALLNQEPGSDVVAEALAAGASVSAVNLAEVVAKLQERGVPEDDMREALGQLPFAVVALDADLAYATGCLRQATRGLGLARATAGYPGAHRRRRLAACQHVSGIAVQVIR